MDAGSPLHDSFLHMAPVLLDGERFRWKFRIELRLAHHTLLLLWNTTILRRESRSP